MSYLGILGGNFKTIVIFEITILEFVKFQSFIQNSNSFKLGSKKAFLGKFMRECEKMLSCLLKSALFNLSNVKFHVQEKNWI